MNRSEFRQSIRDRYGYPERGKIGNDRLNRDINHGVRKLWGELPEMMLREEMRLRLEKAVADGTLSVSTTDPLVMKVVGNAADLAVDGTLRGRWIEIVRADRVYSRRVRDVYIVKGPPDLSYVVLDEPWDNNSDTGLVYRIFSKEHMLPADVAKVRQVFRCINQQPGLEIPMSLFPNELAEWRLGAWADSGTIQAYARGDLHTIPAPHYTPTVAKKTGDLANGDKWGWSSSGVEHDAAFVGSRYGPAGTFTYRVCHVWGRGQNINPTQANVIQPWLISSPSAAAAKVTTTWGASHITVATPDVDYIYGYGRNSTFESFHRHGTEKWIFRARHATEAVGASNHAYATFVEDDEVYYLWRVLQGYETTTIDRGDDDPVDKRVMLKDFQGHQSLRFDRTPSEVQDLLLRIVRRPPTMDYDSDAVLVPPECHDMLRELVAAHILGDRDGEPARKSAYYKAYERAIGDLIGSYAFSGHDRPQFANGISPRSLGRVHYGPIKEI